MYEFSKKESGDFLYSFETANQGNSSYLILRLNETDAIDDLAVGMMQNNQIPGLLPMSKRWEKGGFSLYYTVSSLTPLSQCYAVLGTEKRLFKFLFDYCNLVRECEEYLLEPSKLLLDENYIFVKAETGAVFVPYLALMETQGDIDVSVFFNQFIHRIEGHLPPKSRIRPILYEQGFHGTFQPETLLDALSSLDEESRQRPPQVVPKEQRKVLPAKPPAETPGQSGRSPVVPAAVLPRSENVQHLPPVNKANATPKKGFLGFGGSKSEKAPGKKKGAKGVPPGVSIDNPFSGARVISELPEMPVAAKTPPDAAGKQKKKFFWEKKPDVKPVDAPAAVHVPRQEMPDGLGAPAVQQLPSPPQQKPGGGYTINVNSLDSGVPGGTIRMSEGGAQDGAGFPSAPTLWLVRRGTQERIQITHSNFHVGRMLGSDEIVDYAVMVSTGYMGADHAYFQIKDGAFYLVDNNSTNGTWLNGKKLQPSTPFAVQAGDVVKMADTIFDLSEH